MRYDGSTQEQAKLYLEWADCARRDAFRAVGRDARDSYLAAAEQWDARALDIKRKLWREGGGSTPRRARGLPHPIPKIVLDRSALDGAERYKREAKRPRTPNPAIPIRSGSRIARANLHC
jgi:hypothetical protein